VTNAAGTWSATVTPLSSGTLTVQYAGTATSPAAAAPAATTTVGAVIVGSWKTTVTLKSHYHQTTPMVRNLFSGTITKTYNGLKIAGAKVTVRFYFHPPRGAARLIGSVVTGPTGTFSAVIAMGASASISVTTVIGTGYSAAASPAVHVTVARGIRTR
jgi:hypothetical protein